MSSGPVFTVRTYTSLPFKKPLDECRFDPWVTQITLSQARPGGYTGASVGLAELPVSGTAGMARSWPRLPQPVAVAPDAHVEVYCGASIINEGRLVETDSTGDSATGLRIVGYGSEALNDNAWYPNAADLSTYSSGRVLLQALADAAPLVPPPQGLDFANPGILHRLAEFSGKTPAAVAQQIGTEGDGSTLYDLMMWERRRCQFIARLAPATPAYREDVDGGVVIQQTYADLVSSVYVRYTDALTGAANQIAGPFTDPTFPLRYGGLTRTKEVQGGTMAAAGAAAFGRTYLAKYMNPTYRVQVSRDGWRGLRLAGGVSRAPWFVRCDEWMQIGELPYLPIIRADVNVTARQMTLQLGDPPLNGLELTRELQRVARATVRNLNPTTYSSR